MKRIELGCGATPREGFDGIDIQDFGQNYVGNAPDILKKMKDESVDEIYASHFFEHLIQDEIMLTLNQCHRVLKKGSQLWIVVPHKDHKKAYVLDHRTFFTEFTFSDYFNKPVWKIMELVTNERPDIHFKAIKL